MDASKCRAPPFRLTNLTQTDILPFLPFPTVPARGHQRQGTTPPDEAAMAQDPELIKQLHQLLQATDVSHL